MSAAALEYGIHHRGRVVVGPDWECEADVVFGFHGFGEARAVGVLVRRWPDGEWHEARPLELVTAIERVHALLVEWDALSKGESPTTARIRAALAGAS